MAWTGLLALIFFFPFFFSLKGLRGGGNGIVYYFSSRSVGDRLPVTRYLG